MALPMTDLEIDSCYIYIPPSLPAYTIATPYRTLPLHAVCHSSVVHSFSMVSLMTGAVLLVVAVTRVIAHLSQVTRMPVAILYVALFAVL